MESKHITVSRRVLVAGRWVLIAGLVFYSLMTTTPFVQDHSEWQRSGWVLGLIVDAAFIMSLSAESTLARYGVTRLGKWPVAFRWTTGLASVFLNIWTSVSERDWVGVAVHLIAPALVMLLAEVGPVYMAALAKAEQQQPEAKPEAQPEDEQPEPWQRETDEPETREQAETPATEPDPIDVAQDFAAQTTEPEDEPKRLSNTEANRIIEEGWRHKLSVTEVAEAAGRHPATVRRKFKQLDAANF